VNLARVIGRVTCSNRVAELGGYRLVLIQPVDEAGAAEGTPVVAVDGIVRAAPGATVWFVNGYEAVDAFDERQPVDAAVVGMADP
jgi:microcompartment protein CcmK/EutM